MKRLRIYLLIGMALPMIPWASAQPLERHNLQFDTLSRSWDEGMPLGNGSIGSLIWQKDGRLRFSLDRADIWDMRPMAGLHRAEFSYQWVQEQVAKKDYKPVQQYFDVPYDREPAPSKIPAGALEFDLTGAGEVTSVQLDINRALCTVSWQKGLRLESFVHATRPMGWFRFQNAPAGLVPLLVAPKYQGAIAEGGEVNSLVGDDLARLNYKQGVVTHSGQVITYKQEGYGGFYYMITVRWREVEKGTIEGVWSISSHYPDSPAQPSSSQTAEEALRSNFDAEFASHLRWWADFWAKSSLRIPDERIEKQWYLEQYKFGSAARRGAPPISLQAVWTADNGRIPPWKGDFHHDLNTQLSYWPAYSGNHLEEAMGYIDHLEQNKDNYRRYTRQYFGVEGLAVPGVTTLDGTEMGGWIQYSLSPTVSSWLAHHYYLQWKYSGDHQFLQEKAYPWVKDVCIFIENITFVNGEGVRQLPISSSPEIHNNKLEAWFLQTTNYDLALMKFALKAGTEMALRLQHTDEVARWQKVLRQFPELALSENQELMFAPTLPYNESHRHFSHLMAIHPLGLIKWEDGEKAQKIITNTLRLLDKIGPAWWCGYSYAWLANVKARAKDGEGAAKALSTFERAFCLSNSFHANGDQTRSGLSNFTYRPFTLEGNFAFAAGLQEMLLQSYAGFIEVLPAIPSAWENLSFEGLRAEGAFLVDAQKEAGKLTRVTIRSEKGGTTRLKLPTQEWKIANKKKMKVTFTENEDFIEVRAKPGGVLSLVRR
jgi:alpha-L-fucosidase 2